MKTNTFTVKATRQGAPSRFLPGAVLIDEYVFLTYQIGVGKAIEKGGMNAYGEGETWEEYKSYKTCYKPIIQGQKFKDMGFDQKTLEKDQTTLTPQQLIEKYHTCLVKMGDNDGLLIENKEEAELKAVLQNKKVTLRNGFRGYMIYERLPSDIWTKLKPYAHYYSAKEIDEWFDDMDDFGNVGEGKYLAGWNYGPEIVGILVGLGWKVIYMDQEVFTLADIEQIDTKQKTK